MDIHRPQIKSIEEKATSEGCTRQEVTENILTHKNNKTSQYAIFAER